MDTQPEPRRVRHIGRGVFLGAMAAGAAGLLIGGKNLPGVQLLASALSADGFQIYTTSGIPNLTAKDYRLHVTGLVGNPKTYTLADVLSMPSTTITKDYHCVTGWVVPKCRWTGVKLSDFLATVEPQAKATHILLASADGSYTESLSRDQTRLPDVMLAYKLNDKALSQEQGYPLRLVIPDMYGFKYIKWVNQITLSDHVEPGYWEQRGYAVDAWLGPRGNYGYA